MKKILEKILFALFALSCSCYYGIKQPAVRGIILMGWQVNGTNTGLKGDYSKLTNFNLNGADAGKGEWVGGTGVRLWLYKNVTIEDRIITFSSSFVANEGGVTLRRCLIRPTGCQEGMPLLSASGITMENCEIDGSLLGINNIAHAGLAAGNSVIKNCSIHDHSGVMISNNSGLTLFENNYVYNVLYEPNSEDHLVGVSVFESSGEGTQLLNNRIEILGKEPSLHLSGAFFTQSYYGNVSNILVKGNLLISAAYVTRITESSNVTSLPFEFNNNRLQLITEYGSGYGYYGDDINIQITPTWIDNYVYDSEAEDCKGDLITI